MKKYALIMISIFMLTSAFAQDKKDNPLPAPYSKSRLVNQTLYISGQISRNPETGKLISGDIKKSTEQCMKNIGAILKANKMGYSDLMMVQIFLLDLNDYNEVNNAYRTFFKDDVYPARVCLEVSKIPGGSDIEISAIAETKKNNGFDLP
jgi:2-iminobutanoate/2-iminopropanoate deaminase